MLTNDEYKYLRGLQNRQGDLVFDTPTIYSESIPKHIQSLILRGYCKTYKGNRPKGFYTEVVHEVVLTEAGKFILHIYDAMGSLVGITQT